MQADKLVYVHHRGNWRLYRWSRDLLEKTSLGDVIPDLETESADDCAALHLHTRAGEPADIVSETEPDESVWIELREVAE
jgi:hypothetical protein